MPTELAKDFENSYIVDADIIKMNVYKEANPNMYLASFAEFIFASEKNKKSLQEPTSYIYNLVKKGIQEFIQYRILCFEQAKNIPIHFVGSIAFFGKPIIEECFIAHNLSLGIIMRRPIEGLIAYYKKNKL